MRLVERTAVDDAVHLLTDGLLVGFAPVFELNYRHSPTPSASEKALTPASIRSAVSYRYILGPTGTACHASSRLEATQMTAPEVSRYRGYEIVPQRWVSTRRAPTCRFCPGQL